MSRDKIPPEILAADLQRITENLGYPPTTREYDAHGEFSARTIRTRFGTWHAAIQNAAEVTDG